MPYRYDADLTLFSPEGRLYQVEYVMRGVGHYGCPIVGVHGEGCCVVACKRDLPVSAAVSAAVRGAVWRGSYSTGARSVAHHCWHGVAMFRSMKNSCGQMPILWTG